MLKTKLLHPGILSALGGSGHFSQILVADANYPVEHTRGPNARVVYLGLTPGIPKTTDVVAVLAETIPIQEAAVMEIRSGVATPIIDEYRKLLGTDVVFKSLERTSFYETVRLPQTTLVIATAESRRFANILLTMGSIKQDNDDAG